MFSVSTATISFKHIFRKHVKPKKQYEMARLGSFPKTVWQKWKVVKGPVLIQIWFHRLPRSLMLSWSSLLGNWKGDVPDVPSTCTCQCLPGPRHGLAGIPRHLSEKFKFPILPSDTESWDCITCGDLGPVLLKMSLYKWLEGNGSAVSWMLLHEDSAALSNVELSKMSRVLGINVHKCRARLPRHWNVIRIGYKPEKRRQAQGSLLQSRLENCLVKKDPSLRHSILKNCGKGARAKLQGLCRQGHK